MRVYEYIGFTTGSFWAYRVRSLLTALGITVGITAVVLLTSIGEGIHQFVLAEFTQFGTNLVAVNPGKVSTHGGPVGVFGAARPLTLEDAAALRHGPHIAGVVSAVQGNAEIKSGRKSRRSTVFGVDHEFPRVFSTRIRQGSFLPADDPRAPRAFVVLGNKVKEELFGSVNPLGEHLRVGGYRFRIIGVMEPKGQILGFDLDDTVYIPTLRSLELFNRVGLMEIDVVYQEGADVNEVVAYITRVLKTRHGDEDFTITTQEQMLAVLSSILNLLTFAVAALGGISLLVGAVGILTIMSIAVADRRAEIGLLRAVGATRGQILALILGEATILAALGGLAGLLLGVFGAQSLHLLIPALPVHTPWLYVALAETLAVIIGLLAGAVPALRAAALNPVEALRTE